MAKDASSEHTALGWDPTSLAFRLGTWGKPLICLLMGEMVGRGGSSREGLGEAGHSPTGLQATRT